MNASKIQIPVNKKSFELTIAHKASSAPFYYVEEADIEGRKVSVAFFDENDPASEIQNITIPTSELIDFTNEFYRDYLDYEVEGLHHQERIPKAGLTYLQENLKSVVTDFINAGKGLVS